MGFIAIIALPVLQALNLGYRYRYVSHSEKKISELECMGIELCIASPAHFGKGRGLGSRISGVRSYIF